MGKALESNTESKLRSIIIKFVSRLVKEGFLKERKVRRNLKAIGLGFSSENRIYINESLTLANRELAEEDAGDSEAKVVHNGVDGQLFHLRVSGDGKALCRL